MNPLALRGVILLAGAAVAFGAGWAVNGWRLGEQIATVKREQAEADAAAKEVARLKELSWSKQLGEARDAATNREINLRRAAAGARNASDGLRDELAELRRQLPELAADACRVRADTLAKLFGQCTARYSGLAEKADRHASDVRTLIDAWPK